MKFYRDYAPCRFGQMHFSVAHPEAATDRSPLFCFHQSPISGTQYALFQRAAATTRAVYCPDTPGFGNSDAPPRVPVIADYAGAMADLIDHLKCGPVDVLGFHTGTLVAMELAIIRPDLVRRLSITSLALFDAELRERNRKTFGQPRPLFTDPDYVGRFYRQEVVNADKRIIDTRRFEMFVERMRAGPNSWWGPEAVFAYDTAGRAKLVTQPALLLVMQDTLANATRDAAKLFPKPTVVKRLDWHGPTAWDEKAQDVAAQVTRYLDGPA